MAVAAQLDLNDLDSLSRTCRGVHDSLLQYRSILLKSTVHCVNEELPVDPDSTLRYRARAGNWYYMEDTSRSSYYNGKAGSCARDMVSQCRKCSTVVCRVSSVSRLPPTSTSLQLTKDLRPPELCNQTTSPCCYARQTSPALSLLPESPRRPPREATAKPGGPSRLRPRTTRDMYM